MRKFFIMKKYILFLLSMLIILFLSGCYIIEYKIDGTPRPVWEFDLNKVDGGVDDCSAPVYYKDKVYILTTRYLHVLDSATGKLDWSVKYRDEYIFSKGILPVVDEKNRNIYFSSNKNELYCVDMTTHKIKWKRDDVNTYHSAPALYNDELYVINNHKGIDVMDINTGTDIRTIKIDGDLNGNGILKEDDDSFMMFDSIPVIEGDIMYFNGGTYTFALDLSKKRDQKEVDYRDILVWQSCKIDGFSYKPLIMGDDVYIAGFFKLHKINKKTGKEIWNYTPASECGPVYYKGNIIFGDKDLGRLMAVNSETGKLVWQTEYFKASPGGRLTEYKGKVYCPAWGVYLCINADNGKIIWQYDGMPDYYPDQDAAVSEKDNLVFIPIQTKGKLIAIRG